MLKHLLAPLDGSDLAEAALPVAADLASKTGARLTLLHVLEQDAPGQVHGQRHLTRPEEAQAYLKGLADRLAATGIEADWHVHLEPTSQLASSLKEHAEELAPDLLVMCAHGRARLRDWLSGNIAQQTLKQGAIPILLLKPGPKGELIFPFHRILAPLDGQPSHEQGLPLAAEMARLFEAEIQLIMVVPTLEVLPAETAATGSLLPGATRAVLDLAEEQAQEYLGRHLAALKAKGLKASASLGRGDPLSLISRTAETAKADLIVLASHGKIGSEAFWAGSLSARLVGRLNASFLLVPISPGG